MNAQVENMVLKQLHHIRAAISDLGEDNRDLKERLSTLEMGLSGVRRDIASLTEAMRVFMRQLTALATVFAVLNAVWILLKRQ